MKSDMNFMPFGYNPSQCLMTAYELVCDKDIIDTRYGFYKHGNGISSSASV
jgi:hypothetical protein